jgi:mono/diheme cytochrome c family protein
VESPSATSRARRQALLVGCLAAAALALAGCGALGYTSGKGDKTKGKTLFQNKCGSCHTLADAGTSGTIGPNLDAAFSQALAAGMTEGTVRQVVRGQIAYAITTTSTGAPGMPKSIVKGADARDVATYVASAVVKDAAANPSGAPAPAPAPAPSPAPTTTATTTTTTTPAPSGGGNAAQAAAGKKVFTGAGGCGSCHTLKDAGTNGTVGPDLDNLRSDAQKAGKPLDAYIHESIADPNAYVVPGFPKGVMPPDFSSTLGKQQIDDLVAYLLSATGGG